MNELKLYRNGALFETIKLSDNSTQVKKIMSDNDLQLQFELPYFANFNIGDYADVFGERYKLAMLPAVSKNSKNFYEFNMTLRGENYNLSEVMFMFYDANNDMREPDFSLMANADMFLDLIIKNLNRIDNTWQKGTAITTDYKNLTFSKENCYNALGKIAEAFETEFWIEGRKVHIIKRHTQTGLKLKQGKNNGLYKINRTITNNTALFTRLYVYGGEKNLPPGYRNYSKRLRLPGTNNVAMVSNITWIVTTNTDGSSTIAFSFTDPVVANLNAITISYREYNVPNAQWHNGTGAPTSPRTFGVPAPGIYEFKITTIANGINYVSTPVFILNTSLGNQSIPILTSNFIAYLEKNVALYGVIEQTEVFDDVYPHRTGKVTAVDAGNIYTFIDSSIDFDVNNQLLPGLAAKVVFNTGQLAGYEFEVASFNNGTKKFTINKNKNENVLEVPSLLIRPAIGDEYVVIDIEMPQAYILAAENELQVKAQKLLDEFSTPNFSYLVDYDQAYLKRFNIVPKIGDIVWLEDIELQVNKPIRIVSVTRSLVNEFDVQVELADVLSKQTIQQLSSAINSNATTIDEVQQNMQTNSLFHNKIIGDLKIEQGTLIAKDIVPKPSSGTFLTLVIDTVTGKVYTQ